MLDNETKRRIDTARDILVGKVPDPKSQVEQITIALIYKFMDDMDADAEELGGEASFFSGEYDKYGWRKIFNPGMGGFEMLSLYSEAILKMAQNPNLPQLFRDIFKNAYLPYRDPETLKSFLKIIDDFSYSHSEKLGDAFEYLLSVLGSQGDAGQFRTPRHIIDFMTALIAPKKNESILDPACGTAGFLISAYKQILKDNSSNYDAAKDPHAFEMHNVKLDELTLNGKQYKGDKITPDERTRLINGIKGYDISPDMVRLSLVNLYLHGFTEPHIYEYDTLTSEDRWNEYFDVILANPPFMSPKGGIRPHKRFSIQSNRSEVLFVDYMAEHLTPTGRAAIIVPEGIIFQSGTAYKSLRKMLVEENYLVGVISLPAGVFNPYSGVKTSILWLDKSLARKTDKIIFAKITADGFDLGAQRRSIKQNDMPELFKKLCNYRNSLLNGEAIDVEGEELISLVDKSDIAEKGEYNLSGERYTKQIPIYSGDFKTKKIIDLCDLQSGFAFDSNLFNENDGFPLIRIRDIKTNCTKTKYTGTFKDEFIVKNGDLIIGMDGEFNTCIWQGGNALLNQRVCRLLNFRNVNRDYVFRIIQKKLKEIENSTFAVTVKHISGKQILDIEIPLPPLPIQEEIVAEIEGYQKIIDGARQIVENYKPKIDIDPEWEMVELGEVFSKVSDSIIPDSIEVDLINYIGLENISQGSGEIVGDFLSNPKEIKSTKTIFQKDDILYGKLRPNLNKVYYSEIEGICSTDIFVLRSTDKVIPKFYYSYFLSETFNKEVLRGLKGAQLPRVGYEHFSKIIIPLPPTEIQQQIVARIEKEQELVNSSKQLIEIFDQKIKDGIAKVWGE
jgi:type I restriction enzyme M protein